MPLYEYQCQECGEVHEVLQKMSDPLFTICSSCGGPLKKLHSAPAIQFKGSGFYVTDYGKAGARESDGSKKGEGAKASEESKGSEGSKGSESAKPETKSDTPKTPAKA
ncbi:MAG TPA: FmdB family zinc ribbon protein [Thermoanaerobaculia bacterium]|nr:FmdB family zinc ribbon protein [Thermoanaerobaculia bacterium]